MQMKLQTIILAAALACGCGLRHPSGEGHEHVGPAEEHAAGEHGHSADEIVFDTHRQEHFGVKTTVAVRTPFHSVIRTGGRLKTAPDDCFSLMAPVSGRVHFAISPLSAGVLIPGGREIAVISSEEIAGGDQLTKLRAAYEAAEAEYLRDSLLAADKIIQKNHYEQSRVAFVNAKAEYEALSASVNGKGVPVRSKGDAYLRSLEVSEGQYVELGSPVAVLTGGRMLTLEAELPARYASSLPAVLDANFSLSSGELASVSGLGGRYLSRSREAVDGYITVAFEVPDHGQLVSGCYSEIWIKTAGSSDSIVLPLESIMEEQGTYSVFIREDEDCFSKRPVRIGGNDGKNVEILDGISEGEEVVTSGAIQIRLASVSAIPAGHSHNH